MDWAALIAIVVQLIKSLIEKQEAAILAGKGDRPLNDFLAVVEAQAKGTVTQAQLLALAKSYAAAAEAKP